ncbi:MAG TPA: hypothetical protein VMP11_06065, partial [Verrucomicrobiae bacterium]|nr:hypothetical protein [Verrucomicrobiae bacterium]
FGANDFGSVMMEENVVSQAGATFRIDEQTIRRLIRELGYEPHRRNNWYQLLNQEGVPHGQDRDGVVVRGTR